MAAAQALVFNGRYFDGRSARCQEVTATVAQERLLVHDSDGRQLHNQLLAQCVLTPPLGASRRFLKCSGGQRLQVDDPAVLAFLDEQLHSHGGLRLVHLLESRWRLVVPCLAGLVLCVWAFMVHAIPLVAEKVAQAMPAPLMARISSDSLELLDDRFFSPSELNRERRAEVEGLFARLCVDFAVAGDCTLLFRKGGPLGANAFALPAGVVVVTDELMALAASNEELVGVLAHELAHVKERHGLRHLIQQAGVFMLISTLLGDMTSLSSLGSALPMMLVESGYSRHFEQEADAQAGRYFLARGRSIQPYKDLLQRLTKDDTLPGVAAFLASHPQPEQRMRALDGLAHPEPATDIRP
jgi:Zn-dependent protease with chaperone function